LLPQQYLNNLIKKIRLQSVFTIFVFENILSTSSINLSQQTKLKIKSVINTLPVIVETLQNISDNYVIYGSEANNSLSCILNFEFIFCFFSLKTVLEQTNILSKYLQSPSINYAVVKEMSIKTYDSLQELRSDECFDKCWEWSQDLVKNNGFLPPKLPRKRKVFNKKLGGGHVFPEFHDEKSYYLISIYFPVLDIVMKEIKDRFDENDLSILNSLMEILTNEKLAFTVVRFDNYSFELCNDIVTFQITMNIYNVFKIINWYNIIIMLYYI